MSIAIGYETEEAVDQAFSNAMNAGAKGLKKPQKIFLGGYSGYYDDPDYHVWEIAMNPFWPLQSGGGLTLPDKDI